MRARPRAVARQGRNSAELRRPPRPVPSRRATTICAAAIRSASAASSATSWPPSFVSWTRSQWHGSLRRVSSLPRKARGPPFASGPDHDHIARRTVLPGLFRPSPTLARPLASTLPRDGNSAPPRTVAAEVDGSTTQKGTIMKKPHSDSRVAAGPRPAVGRHASATRVSPGFSPSSFWSPARRSDHGLARRRDTAVGPLIKLHQSWPRPGPRRLARQDALPVGARQAPQGHLPRRMRRLPAVRLTTRWASRGDRRSHARLFWARRGSWDGRMRVISPRPSALPLLRRLQGGPDLRRRAERLRQAAVGPRSRLPASRVRGTARWTPAARWLRREVLSIRGLPRRATRSRYA